MCIVDMHERDGRPLPVQDAGRQAQGEDDADHHCLEVFHRLISFVLLWKMYARVFRGTFGRATHAKALSPPHHGIPSCGRSCRNIPPRLSCNCQNDGKDYTLRRSRPLPIFDRNLTTRRPRISIMKQKNNDRNEADETGNQHRPSHRGLRGDRQSGIRRALETGPRNRAGREATAGRRGRSPSRPRTGHRYRGQPGRRRGLATGDGQRPSPVANRSIFSSTAPGRSSRRITPRSMSGRYGK